MRKISTALIISLLVVFAGLAPGAIAADKLLPIAKPILLPARETADDCTQSSVTITLSGKGRFTVGNQVSVQSSIENGPVSTNQALQTSGQVGLQRINNSPGSALGPSTANVSVQLCANELPETDPTFLWVYLDLQSPTGASKAKAKVKMPILKRTAALIATDEFIDTCKIANSQSIFGNNIIFDVVASKGVRDYYTEGVMGMHLTLQGTLVRQGLVAANDVINIVYYGEKTRLLATTKTNSKGAFKLAFVAPRENYSDAGSVSMVVGSKSVAIDGINLVMPGSSESIQFDWLVAPRATSIGSSNWIPSFSQECLDAFANYEENNDDSHRDRAILISAALGLIGTANKSQSDKKINTSSSRGVGSTIYMTSPFAKKIYTKSSSGSGAAEWDSIGNIGSGSGSSYDSDLGGSLGKCYVRGHYRSGKWVNGYYRSC